MFEFLSLLSPSNFMPHGHCFFWKPLILWTHVSADAMTAVAYYSIPIALVILVRKRADLAFNWMVLLFAAFIFLCGTTHLFNIWTIWIPSYWTEGVVKLATGIVSVGCAVALWPLLPKILALPSAAELQMEIQRRQEAQERMARSHVALERNVRQRSAQLNVALRQLKRFAAIVDSSQDAIIGLSLEKKIRSWNPAAEKLFGYEHQQMQQVQIDDLFDDLERAGWKENFNKTVGGQTLPAVEITGKRCDGTEIPISLSISPFFDESGLLDGVSLIARDNSERTMAQAKLAQSLSEKELLLKEIHHRVKNNMQVISSLLKLQSTQVVDPDTRSLLRESENRVHSMALVHEKLYRSDGLAKIDFKSYIEELANDLLRSYAVGLPRLTLETDIQRLYFSIDQAIPCGLILNELISNSLKHAFSAGDAGVLRIELKRDGSHAVLSVSDNGSGLPEEIDLTRPRSLGLRVVMTLSEQITAEVDIERNSGTSFSFRFALLDDFTSSTSMHTST